MLARLLRQIECPVHGARIIRLPGHRFRAELSEEVKPVRDAAGQIDIQGTMQAVTSVIENLIREYPDQWRGYTVAGGSACSSATALTGGISSTSAMRRSISPITRFENGPRCM